MASIKTDGLSGEEVVDLNRKHVFFSWSVQKDVHPIPVESGKGIYFWDKDGRRYMDFSSQLMSLNIGYQDPRVVAAIQEQAARLCAAHPSMATEPKARLGKEIAEIAPGNLNKVFFTLGGAEANENAIKFSRQYTKKSKILARYISYHGATYGAITLSGDYRRPPVEPGIPGVVHVFDPYCYRCPFGHTLETCHRECITSIEKVIQYENPDTVAALFMEGVTGSNGILVPPDDYWPRLREITQKYGVLLVSDEVMSGFGRTGEWFAVDNWGVVPDLITFAKGVTSGYLPLGGVIVSDPIADYFEDKYLYMGLTYFGHPMSCAAGIATIQVYREDHLLQNAKTMGKELAGELEGLKEKHPSVGDVRYIGLFSVIELVKDRGSKEPMDAAVMNAIRSRLIEEGLSTFVSKNMVFVVPPIIINPQELKDGLAIVDRALALADQAI
ncbi:MAG: aminotransferase class III-fold pyridoxal phosphate-dependent enzyme [Chloroflexi bacterium]|nr:aminotransferase class III-fold pyridoxal phosphate-dependent enzyme [Chloroflexota bacterium]